MEGRMTVALVDIILNVTAFKPSRVSATDSSSFHLMVRGSILKRFKYSVIGRDEGRHCALKGGITTTKPAAGLVSCLIMVDDRCDKTVVCISDE